MPAGEMCCSLYSPRRSEMTPRRLEGLLALALKSPAERRTPPDFGGAEGADPADGLREPLLGSTTDPSRAGDAGLQGLCAP